MTTAFISYSTKDELLAQNIHASLEAVGVKTFIASSSIKAGEEWNDIIFQNLREAQWVFFLASKNSCASTAVQHEIGASLIKKKNIIPVLIDIDIEELPPWTKKFQAINIADGMEKLEPVFVNIAKKVRSEKFVAGIILGALAVGLICMVKK